MPNDHVRSSIESLIEYFEAHPEIGQGADRPATAVLEDGLRCRATGPGGATITTDMPMAIETANPDRPPFLQDY